MKEDPKDSNVPQNWDSSIQQGKRWSTILVRVEGG